MTRKEDEDIGKSLTEYESLEKQLEIILLQKNQLTLQIAETRNALEELKHAKGDVYRSIGSLLIKTTKEEAGDKLTEKLELMEVKQKAVGKEEEKLKRVLGDLQEKLKEQMKAYEKKGSS